VIPDPYPELCVQQVFRSAIEQITPWRGGAVDVAVFGSTKPPKKGVLALEVRVLAAGLLHTFRCLQILDPGGLCDRFSALYAVHAAMRAS